MYICTPALFFFLLFIADFAVEKLQGFYACVFMVFYIMDSACGCFGCRNGGHVRNLCLDGSLTQVAVIMDAVFAHWRVYDHVNLSVGDHIQDIGASLLKLVDSFSGMPASRISSQVFSVARMWKPSSWKLLASSTTSSLSFAVYGDQHSAAERKLGLCCFLRLVEGFAVGSGKSENLTCGAHFRENGVNLLEHIEGEYCFLNAVVGDLLLFSAREPVKVCR